ncbi:hypothetical protein LTR78_004967 [Recurvomyces mirabilis]|uniref:Uncharacterized protein n=1 Tax=Recurvomyces mirabilis TaxID=574656 RepID=A0AAE0WNI7_9PEZI|nr:hypothetical protein LTR78_004967 [Recurvomyces mirabilis]KAK5158416.1 hypothetical protein LTS14_003435 [Recurvomyces mirabilis]
MNDHTLQIDLENRISAYLDGDAATRWMLDIKQQLEDATIFEEDGEIIPEDGGFASSIGCEETLFNVTMDMNIDEFESDEASKRSLASSPDRVDLRLLHEPLPLDLQRCRRTY